MSKVATVTVAEESKLLSSDATAPQDGGDYATASSTDDALPNGTPSAYA